MTTRSVKISFEKNMLNQLDKIARNESRSRSEVIGAAVQIYMDRRKRWDDLFRIADNQMKGRQVTEQEIVDEIHELRKSRRKNAIS